MNLSKKNAVISGASRGIGKETAMLLAAKGMNLALCARSLDDLIAVKSQIKDESPDSDVFIMSCDLTKKEEVIAFGKAALAHFGHIDVLINNAGTFIPGKISEEEDGVFEMMIQTNLASVYHLTRAVVSGMLASGDGYILNVCSTASITPYTNGGSYCISKFGELGLTRVLREELKDKHIKVTAILPGATKTDSWDGTELPDERFINPKSVAKVIYQCIASSADIVHEEVLIRPQEGDID